MEVLGNLLDNAFKYADSRLRIRSTVHHDEQFGEQIKLVVEDDGEGVAPEQRQFVLQRGARADTLAAGQGIGLAVVSDIVASYSGSIEIDASPTQSLGGARVTLWLPQFSARI
jgi:signal transduction histidine kinase